jgi:CO/xanthine dehydrogenase FAD-binding subunit
MRDFIYIRPADSQAAIDMTADASNAKFLGGCGDLSRGNRAWESGIDAAVVPSVSLGGAARLKAAR